MRDRYGGYLKAIGLIVLVLTIASFLVGLFSEQGVVDGFRIVYGLVYVFYLPAFLLTFVFYPVDRQGKRIDWPERFLFSLVVGDCACAFYFVFLAYGRYFDF
jgi:uncharacterized membrane protein